MMRLAVLAFSSMLIAWPVSAQVINGETPLDETPVSREAPAEQSRAPTTPSPSATDQDAARRDLPQTAPRRD